MSTTQVGNDNAAQSAAPAAYSMALEVMQVPVADVDRAKAFYESLGWRLDIDFKIGDAFRGVQFTPPGSPTSIQFGEGAPSAEPGSAGGMILVVDDIDAARDDLIGRGVDVGEVFHLDLETGPQPGHDPQGRSYTNRAEFADPDGNGWVLQQITERLPGRV